MNEVKWKRALIKKTGEVLDIHDIFKKSHVTSSFTFDDLETKDFKSKSLGKFYLLSNGYEYPEDQLVVGREDIREWKLNNIIK
jgi:hypothetical protein